VREESRLRMFETVVVTKTVGLNSERGAGDWRELLNNVWRSNEDE
jgi:hypothetical protein